jgi:hypothetical protein
MDLIRENIATFRTSVFRNDFQDTNVIDVFTAFSILVDSRIDYSIGDDKNFAFLLGCLRNVPRGEERQYWLRTMFSVYEQLSGLKSTDAKWTNWLLLQANLVYLNPLD